MAVIGLKSMTRYMIALGISGGVSSTAYQIMQMHITCLHGIQSKYNKCQFPLIIIAKSDRTVVVPKEPTPTPKKIPIL
jgi:hypothetical protein